VSYRRGVLVAIFLLGAALRAIDVWRPVDGRQNDIWRESDVSAVARNFYREGMNPLYPRIDWRGTGPGYAEMELPVLPWLMAATYQVIGVHEVIGRIIEYVFSLVALGSGLAMLAYLLPPVGAAAGGLFFAVSPLSIRVATSLQPEGLMLLCYVLAGYAFIRWLDSNAWRDFVLAVGATALAILAKEPAAHIGLFFLIMLIARRGFRAFADWRVLVFGLVSLAPSVWWYLHAKTLWLTYGNSLGVSNERHFTHADFFTSSRHVKDLVRLELIYVWGWVGVLLAAIGVVRNIRNRAVQTGLAWLASVAVFYVLAEHTVAEQWAVYYHVVTVPGASILFGAGAAVVLPSWRTGLPGAALASLVPLTYAGLIQRDFADARPHVALDLYACARIFAPHIPPHAVILASGGNCEDAEGEPIAYNASYMFYWVDRKGFNLCRGKGQTVDSVAAFAAKGAEYFIAEKRHLALNPGLEAALRARYPVLAECPIALLFDIRQTH
jgi:hypothetical protein